jgi:hypothetical protein
VEKGFYSDEIIEKIKDAVQAMYAAAKKTIDRENIIISSSPTMSPFIASARIVGKIGKPKKSVKSKLSNMGSVENFLNKYSNPKKIIKESGKFTGIRYWCSINVGFRAYIDFFMNETKLGDEALKDYKNINTIMANEVTHLCYDMLIYENFCVVSKKPIFQDLDTSGEYPIARNGRIEWEDGTIINY